MRCPGTRTVAIYGVGSDGKAPCLHCGKRVGINPAAKTLRPHTPAKDAVDGAKRVIVRGVAALVRHHVSHMEADFVLEALQLNGLVDDGATVPQDVRRWIETWGNQLADRVAAFVPGRGCGRCGYSAPSNATVQWRCPRCNP